MTLFEKIIRREIPSHIVYEDDLAIAFLDISQVTKGHTLVVPKKPFPDLYSLDSKTSEHLLKVCVIVAKALKKAFHLEGLNMVNNNGALAGQSVFHFHIHLIPRYPNDDYLMLGVNHQSKYTKEDLNGIKEAIIEAQS